MAFHPLITVPEDVLIDIMKYKEQSGYLQDLIWILTKRNGKLSQRQIDNAKKEINDIRNNVRSDVVRNDSNRVISNNHTLYGNGIFYALFGPRD